MNRDPDSSDSSLFQSLSSKTAAWVYLAAGWLYGLPLGLPISPYDVDRSWQVALNWAAARGLTHGEDILFTYGPLGFLFNPVLGTGEFTIATCLLRIAIRTAVAVQFAFLIQDAFQRAKGPMFQIFGLALALAFTTTNDLIVVSWVVAFADAIHRGAKSRSAFLGLVGGGLLLTKFNNGIQCLLTLVAVVALIGSTQARNRDRWIALATATGAWWIAPLGAWAAGWLKPVPFLVDSWRLASSYSQLSIHRTGEELTATLTLGFLCVLALQALHRNHRQDRWMVLTCLPAAFLFFKSAFVRAEDLHVMWGTAAFAGLWAAASVQLQSPTLIRQLRITIVVSAVLCALSAAEATLLSPRVWQQKALDMARGILPGTEPLSPSLFQAPPSVWENTSGASLDVYPHDIGLLEPVKDRWQPRYVLQAYATLHPTLDLKTAQRLEQGLGAEWILFKLESLDMSHLALTEVAGWVALSHAYAAGPDPVDLPDSIWLKRREHPLDRETRVLEAQAWPVKQWVELPEADGVVRLALHIRRTFAGTLFDTLFKVYPPVLDVEFTDGEARRYRFNWRNAANGMIVSHIPRTRSEAKAWFAGQLPRNVRRLRIAQLSQAFDPSVSYAWTEELEQR